MRILVLASGVNDLFSFSFTFSSLDLQVHCLRANLDHTLEVCGVHGLKLRVWKKKHVPTYRGFRVESKPYLVVSNRANKPQLDRPGGAIIASLA